MVARRRGKMVDRILNEFQVNDFLFLLFGANEYETVILQEELRVEVSKKSGGVD